jgi:hypothetical protein
MRTTLLGIRLNENLCKRTVSVEYKKVSETNLSKVANRPVHITSVDFEAGRQFNLYNYIFPHFLSNDIAPTFC